MCGGGAYVVVGGYGGIGGTTEEGKLTAGMENLQLGDNIIITIDSMYAVRLLKHQCRAKENLLLVNVLLHLAKFASSKLTSKYRWSPVHSDNNKGRRQLEGTGVADVLAGTVGAKRAAKADWWKRDFQLANWEEQSFCQRISTGPATKKRRNPRSPC